MWIAKDRNGGIFIYSIKPYKVSHIGEWQNSGGGDNSCIDSGSGWYLKKIEEVAPYVYKLISNLSWEDTKPTWIRTLTLENINHLKDGISSSK